MEKKGKQMKKSLIGLFSSFFAVLLSTAAVQQRKPEVPYVPTPDEVVAEMLKIADVGRNDVLYDLGCGDGRIVITAAKKLGCRGVGIDIDPQRIKESRENAIEAGVSDRVEFLLMDLFEADISEATVVTLYLLSEVNLRLRPKLFQELNPGTRVVSHDFDMDGWKPDNKVTIDNTSAVHDPFFLDNYLDNYWDNYWDKHVVYFWIIPANVTGTWKWKMPAISGKKRYTLKLDQTFQEIKGKAFEGIFSIPVHIKDGKIKGNKLEFTLERKLKGRIERMHFKGIKRSHIMEGYVRIEGRSDIKEKWKAKRIPSTLRSIESSNISFAYISHILRTF